MGPLPFVTRSKDRVLIDAFVQARAARTAVVGIHGTALKLKVKAPPTDDRANRAVEELLAEVLDLPRSGVVVVGGHSSRRKRIAVTGIPQEEVVTRLDRVLSSRAHEPGQEADRQEKRQEAGPEEDH
ncbi:MAG: DUF167 domain-containing protein [Actinomycetota bacterium]